MPGRRFNHDQTAYQEQLLKQKKVMVTVNKRIASEATNVYDGDEVNIVAHDGMGRSGLTPAMY